MQIRFKYYDYGLDKYRVKTILSLTSSCVIKDMHGNRCLSQEKVTRQIKAWFDLSKIKGRIVWQSTPDFHLPVEQRKGE